MTEQLKPCPFCGGEAVMLGEDDGMYQCVCRNCESVQGGFYDFPEEAAFAWNTRPLEDALQKELDEAREAQSFLKTEAMLDAQRETLVLAAKNKMLRVALGDIKKVVEDSQDKQNPSYFDLDAKDAVFILETIENALLWSPK